MKLKIIMDNNVEIILENIDNAEYEKMIRIINKGKDKVLWTTDTMLVISKISIIHKIDT